MYNQTLVLFILDFFSGHDKLKMISVFYIKAKLIDGQYYNLYFSEISSNPIIECICGESVSFSTLLYSVEGNILM